MERVKFMALGDFFDFIMYCEKSSNKGIKKQLNKLTQEEVNERIYEYLEFIEKYIKKSFIGKFNLFEENIRNIIETDEDFKLIDFYDELKNLLENEFKIKAETFFDDLIKNKNNVENQEKLDYEDFEEMVISEPPQIMKCYFDTSYEGEEYFLQKEYLEW